MKKTILCLFIAVLFIPAADFSATENPSLDEGIRQYRLENYEEAIEILQTVRQSDPQSAKAAFFLGLAYKETMDYEGSLPHFEDAATLTPKIDAAVVELVFVLQQLKKTDEARKWIRQAEQDEIAPARVAFLKGMVARDEENHQEAIQSFENAGKLDPSMAQAADYQIAMCLLKQKKLAQARKRFQSVVDGPQSDLSGFARQYTDALEKRMEMEKPFRFTVGLFGQYDSNVVLEPGWSGMGGDITDEESWGMLATAMADYTPRFDSPFLFSAQYAVSGTFHQKHSTSHDIITNTIQAAPGYDFGHFAVNFAGRYSHSLLRSPGYGTYLREFGGGPQVKKAVGKNHLFEIYTGYLQKEYADPAQDDAEDRDSKGMNAHVSWIWLYEKGSFLNVKGEYINEDADGGNWDNDGYKGSVNTVFPLMKNLKLQLGGELFLQEYENNHTTFNLGREDEIHNYTGSLMWEFMENALALLQYSRTRAHSNLKVYDYERDIYSAGVEYRF